MKIKLLLIGILGSLSVSAQEVADHWYFDVQAGPAQTFGNMTDSNKGTLIYNGLGGAQFGFSKYGSTGALFKKGVVGVQFGYLFYLNQLDPKYLKTMEPTPSTLKYQKRNQLLHGPWIRLEYTTNTRVAPFIGIGAHLLAVRGAKFDLGFNPQDNFYKEVYYNPGGWGRINASFSGSAGLRVTMPGNWCLALQYQLFIRDTWTVNYRVKAVPATLDSEEVESRFLLIQKGWNQHIDLKVQFPLN